MIRALRLLLWLALLAMTFEKGTIKDCLWVQVVKSIIIP